MSMAFLLWPFLCLLIPSTWAGPLSTASLTPALAKIVPICAQSCLGSFIAENFPLSVCGPPPNFSCLCTSDSTSGFTIGEGSLECVAAECSFDDSDAVSVYEVCSTVQNAIPNTHSILTAVQTSVLSYTAAADQPAETDSDSQLSNSPSNSFTAAFRSAAASSTVAGSTTKVTSAKSSSLSRSTTQKFQPTTSVFGGGLSSTTPIATTAPSTTQAAAAATSSFAAPPVLTKPQIAGVAVAGVGSAAIAFGLCFLIFCLRRKRRSHRHSVSSSFGGDKIVDSEESTPDMAAIARQDFAHFPQPREELAPALAPVIIPPPAPRRKLRLETPATSSEDGWDQYQRDMNTEYMGPQVTPKSVRDYSPITPASNRTRNSQLLPDKPSGNRYSLFPPPSRTPQNSVPGSSLRPPGNTGSSTASRSPGSVNTSQSNLQRESYLRQPRSDPFLDACNSSPPNIYPYVQASRPRSQHLRPQDRPHPAFRVPPWDQPTGVVRKPLPAHQSTNARGVLSYPDRAQQPGPIRPYRPPPSRDQHYMAVSDNPHKRNEPSRNISNASTRFSNGSDTSIEEEAAPALPKLRSPFQGGAVRYPSVPVSAAESPTRHPIVAELPSRSDSLANRRLGKQRAREIADRLPDERQTPPRRKSAKYQILVSPGRYGIDNSGSPSSTRFPVKLPSPDPHW